MHAHANYNKRSMDLGALLDTCNWCDKWQGQGHSRSNVIVSFDSPYMLSY